MEEKMFESVELVEERLKQLQERIQPIGNVEYNMLLEVKKDFLAANNITEGLDDSEELYLWD